jgi:hypothetical protein
LRCSLRRQQPWLGSRRFDDPCDVFLLRACSQARCVLGLAQRSQQRGCSGGMPAGVPRWDYAVGTELGWGRGLRQPPSSARKRGAKLWSVLLLRAAVAVPGRRLCASSRAIRAPGDHSGANLPVARPYAPMPRSLAGPRSTSRHPISRLIPLPRQDKPPLRVPVNRAAVLK